MSSGPSPTHDDREREANGEPPKKRVRKGTKSCWECKRRKIRCQLSSDNATVCAGCLQRGTTCLSQEFPESQDQSGGSHVGERLGRVELLLEKLVAKITQFEEDEEAAKINTPESMGTQDVLTPYPLSGVVNINESVPIISLFEDEVMDSQIGRRTENHNSATQTQINTPQSTVCPGGRAQSCRMTKMDRLRQVLVDLLPIQEDMDIIYNESGCWLFLHALSDHWSPSRTVDHAFDMTAIRKHSTPLAVAKNLLCISVMLQQLPPHFDQTRLHIGNTATRMDKIMSNVQTLITADDELVSSMEGLDCLVLQGVHHMNNGNPRRAWLTFRRALNVCQLIGIHKTSNKLPGGRGLWQQIIQADRYLALLLGLPEGSSDNEFLSHETFQNPEADKDQLFSRKLSEIASFIIERNQTENTSAYATTQGIDEKIDHLGSQMPSSWWAIPPSIPPSYKAQNQRAESAKIFEKIMSQIWYFQLKALLHLPFMLRAATDRRYDYSKFSCLKASRDLIHRYLALRIADSQSLCCRIVDFGALTATVTLLLGLLDSADQKQTTSQRESDRELVHAVLVTMEHLSVNDKDVVASQSVSVLKSLIACDSAGEQSTGYLRLTIPYFGTINVARTPPTPPSTAGTVNTPQSALQQQQPQRQQQRQQQQQTLPNDAAWGGLPYHQNDSGLAHQPMVQFTSSQFPPLVPEDSFDWANLPEADTLFFDSLLGSDIDNSSWIF